MDDNGNMRSTYNILNDLSKVWGNLTNAQQSYIAQQIAGTRQARTLLSVMNNWDTAEKSMVSALNSTGSAAEENTKYIDSIEGRLATLKSTFQQVAQTTMNSGEIKWIVSAATEVLKLVNATGGLIPVLVTISGLLLTIKANTASKFVTPIIEGVMHLSSVLSGLKNNFSFKEIKSSLSSFVGTLNLSTIATKRNQAAILSKAAADEIEKLAIMRKDVAEKGSNLTKAQASALSKQETIATNASTAAKEANAIATQTLGAAISTVLSVVGIAITVITVIVQLVNKHKQAEIDRTNAIIESSKKIQEQAENMNELYGEFIKYQKIVNKTTDEEEAFANSKEKLCAELKDHIALLKDVSYNTDKYRENLEQVTEEDIFKAWKEQQADAFVNLGDSIDAYTNKLQSASSYSQFGVNVGGFWRWEGDLDFWNHIKDEYKNTYDTVLKYFNYPAIGDKTFQANGDSFIEQYSNMLDAFHELQEKAKTDDNVQNSEIYKNLKSMLDNSKEAYEDYVKAIGDYQLSKITKDENFQLPDTTQAVDDMINQVADNLKAEGVGQTVVNAIIENLQTEWKDYKDILAEEVKNANTLTEEELKALSESVGNTVSSISTLSSAWKEMCENGKLSADTVLKLIDMGYASALSYDNETHSIKLNKDALKDLTKAKLEEAKANAQAKLGEASGNLKESAGLTEDYTGRIEELNQAIEEFVNSGKANLDDPLVQLWISAKGVYDVTQELASTSDENIFGAYDESEKVATDLKNVASAAKNVASQVNTLSSAWKEQSEKGELSYSTILDLIDAGYASALQYNAETGAITLNKDAMIGLIKVKLINQKLDIEAKKQDAADQIAKEAESVGMTIEQYKELARAKAANNAIDLVDTNKSTTTSTTTRATQMNEVQVPVWYEGSKEDWLNEHPELKTQDIEKTVDVKVDTVVDYDSYNAYLATIDSLLNNIDNAVLGVDNQGGSGLSNTGATGVDLSNKDTKTPEELANEQASAWKDAYSQLYKANRMTIDEYYNSLESLLEKSSFYSSVRNLTTTQMDEILKSTDESLKGTRDLIKSYLDLSNEVNSVRLDRIVKEYNKLKEAINACSDAISNLGNIDTFEDKSKEAAILAKQYGEICNALKEIEEKQQNSNLVYDKNNQLTEYGIELQKQYNELLQQRVSIEDKVASLKNELVEQKKQNDQLALTNTFKEKMLAIEKQIYGNEGKDDYTHRANERIDAIQGEIDALQAKKDAQEKVNEQLDYENKLTELQIELINTMNNKTTKVLTKQQDGTWQYEYTADQDKVKDLQNQIKDTEKDYNNWQFDQQIDALQKQIDNEQSILNTMDKQYEDVKYHLDKLEELEKAQIEAKYADTETVMNELMEELNIDGLDIGEALNKLTAALNEANELNKDLELQDKQLDVSGLDGNAMSQEAVSSAKLAMGEYSELQKENLAPIKSSIDSIVNSANSILDKIGDENSYTIDLSSLNGVDILSNSSSLNELTDYIKSQGASGLGSTINIAKIEFPNCVSDIKEIQNAIIGLPAIALQESKKQG